MTAGTGPADALEPVRRAVLRDAHAEAEARLRKADQAAREQTARARAEADRILHEAHEAGIADAQPVAAAELAGARRHARALLLAAQRDAYEQLRAAVAARLGEVAGERLRDALTARIVTVLGPQARIEPAPDGGVTGGRGNRAVDCSLAALTDHAIDMASDRLEEVWT